MRDSAFHVLTTALSLSIGLAGCTFTSSQGLNVWAVDDVVRILPDSGPPLQSDVFDSYADRIAIAAGINEVVAFQLILRSEVGVTANVELSVDDFTSDSGRISSRENVRLFREHVIPVSRYRAWFLRYSGQDRARREYPDALIPLDAPRYGQPFSVPQGRNVPIWVDIRVPPGTPPGVFRGLIHLQAEQMPAQSVPVELTVHPIALPNVAHIPLLAGVDWESLVAHHLRVGGEPYAPRTIVPDEPLGGQALELITETFRLLHEHRLSPFLHRFYPGVDITAGEEIEVNWENYDAVVGDFLDGTAFEDRVPVSAWPLPVDRTVPPPPSQPGAFSAVYHKNLASYLRQCAAHFRERGWYDRHFVLYDPFGWPGSFEPPRAVPDAREIAFARHLRAAEVGARFLAFYPPQDMRAYGWHLADGQAWQTDHNLVSVFSPSVRWFDPRAMRKQREAGREGWFSIDQPPFAGSLAIEAHFVHARSIPWIADRLEAQTVIIVDVNQWSEQPFETDIEHPGQPSDSWLLYPGSFAGLSYPVPSIRLKQLRRGMQDHAYLQLLRQRGHGAVADRLVSALIKRVGMDALGEHVHDTGPVGWARRPYVWSLARRLMTDVLAETRDPDDDAAALAARVDWARFTRETSALHLAVEGVRVDPRPDGAYDVQVHVVVVNDRNRPLDGHLAFTDLGPGWSSSTDRWALVNVQPGHMRRMTLTAQTNALACNFWGVAELGIRIQVEGEPARDITARLTQLAVRQLDQPLKIDGDLNDWPPGSGNVAGDFLLVRSLDGSEDGVPDRRAQAQTAVFVCRDDEFLYIAMNCMGMDAAGVVASTTNHIEYDRETPIGEDLVEVVIDPTNGRTGSTGDLYHLLIKANGAALAEQGVGWQPPTGPRRIWPVDLRVAVSTPQPDQWHVELAIPLRAFGPEALRQPFWGINFGRFEPRRGAYSSWSGATRHLYNPRGLGNLVW